MFGTSAFAARLFGASPQIWRLIADAQGLSTGAAQVVGQGSGVAETGANLSNLVSLDARVTAVFSTSGIHSAAASLAASVTVGWNASSAIGLASQTAGISGAVATSTGLATGLGNFTGYRMWAYNQAFPVNPSSGSIVQIGSRLFEWRVSSARWHPAGPAP